MLTSTAAWNVSTNHKERLAGSWVQGTVENFRLFDQIIGRVDGCQHPFHGEESSQIGGVGRYDDQREQPPTTSY